MEAGPLGGVGGRAINGGQHWGSLAQLGSQVIYSPILAPGVLFERVLHFFFFLSCRGI
jgi:hypothetical protein